MIWAIIKPFMVMLIGLFMLVMLYLLWVEGDMLKAYWQSELVYAASAEEINPAHEGRMVRVTGPLCTHEAVSVGNLGSYPGVIEIQSSSVNAHAEQLQLGAWQVQGLYGARSTPFTYFVINTPGVHWVEVNDTQLALLPSGVEVTLVGRQRGKTLDMSEPVCKVKLGKPAVGFLAHANDSPNADISLRAFQSVTVFALLAYFGTWLLLGATIGRSLRWGLAAGAVLLSIAVLIALIS